MVMEIATRAFRTGILMTASVLALSLAAGPALAAAPLSCHVNKTDGISLRTGQTIIENTSGKMIPEGTTIDLAVSIVPSIGRTKVEKSKYVTYDNVEVHGSRTGGDTPANARGCTAKVSLVQPKDTVKNTPARSIK